MMDRPVSSETLNRFLKAFLKFVHIVPMYSQVVKLFLFEKAVISFMVENDMV
jgi:hypothetical protein